MRTVKLKKDTKIGNRILEAGDVIRITTKEDRRAKIEEAFLKGSAKKVMTLFAKSLSKKIPVSFQLDIPFGFKNDEGVFVGYNGYFPNKRILRINFLLANSERIHSVSLSKVGLKTPYATLIFEEDANIMQISKLVLDFVHGKIKENRDLKKYVIKEAGIRDRKNYERVENWTNSVAEAKNLTYQELLGYIQNTPIAELHREFIRSGGKLSYQPFKNIITDILAKNAMKHNRATGHRIRRNQKEAPIILQAEKGPDMKIKGTVGQIILGWRKIFESLEKKFNLLMSGRGTKSGMLIYGIGGTGKSYYLEQERHNYRNIMQKGAPTKGKFMEFLYSGRNADLIIVDDGDKIITNPDTLNLLKEATTDTGDRAVHVPGSAAKFKDIKRDVMSEYNPDTEQMEDKEQEGTEHFIMNAKIVLITNLENGPKDPALNTRLYQVPIFLDPLELLDKVKSTLVGNKDAFEPTKEEVDTIGDFIMSIIVNKDLTKGKKLDNFINYRVFKAGVSFLREFGEDWKEEMLMEMGIAIKTSVKDIQASWHEKLALYTADK